MADYEISAEDQAAYERVSEAKMAALFMPAAAVAIEAAIATLHWTHGYLGHTELGILAEQLQAADPRTNNLAQFVIASSTGQTPKESPQVAGSPGCSRRATGTTLTVSDSPKMLRETLCVAASAVGQQMTSDGPAKRAHIDRLQRLTDECDRHRPLGPDGKHGDRHTPTCGCEGPTGGRWRVGQSWGVTVVKETPGAPDRLVATAQTREGARLIVDALNAGGPGQQDSAVVEELRAEAEEAEEQLINLRELLEQAAKGRDQARADLTMARVGARVELETLRGQLAAARQLGDAARADLAAARTRIAWQATLAAQLRMLVTAVDQWTQRRRAGHQGWDEARTFQQQAGQARGLLDQLDSPPSQERDQLRDLLAELGWQGRRVVVGPTTVRTHEEIRAQVLYEGLPKLPVEPGASDDAEADREPPQS